MSNLRVRMKILLLAIFFAVGLSVITFIGVYNMNESKVSMDALYNENLISVDITGDLRTQTRAISVRLLENLFSEDKSQMETKNKGIKTFSDHRQ